MKVIIFIIIALTCIICAISHGSSIGGSSSFSSYSPSSSSINSSYSQTSYLDHTASGRFPIEQRRYRFKICKVNNEYRAYIELSPSYRSRATDGHSTHRHYDGRYYICWSQPVRSYDNMVTIAKQWADCTQRYIESGTRF